MQIIRDLYRGNHSSNIYRGPPKNKHLQNSFDRTHFLNKSLAEWRTRLLTVWMSAHLSQCLSVKKKKALTHLFKNWCRFTYVLVIRYTLNKNNILCSILLVKKHWYCTKRCMMYMYYMSVLNKNLYSLQHCKVLNCMKKKIK